MMSFFIYLLKASLGLVFAHFLYRFFLRKHTKFQLNRFFLLLFIGISLWIPLVEFSVDISSDTALAKGITYVESLDNGWEETELVGVILSDKEQALEKGFNLLSLLTFLYITGFIIFAAPILLSWKKLFQLISQSSKYKEGGFFWLESPEAHSFSAFHYIFLGKKLNVLPKAEQIQIIQHEKVHARGGHSFDLLFIDLLRIFFWFHPLKNILKKDLQELHECMADAQVVQQENKYQYSRLIVQLAHTVPEDREFPLPIHAFAYSPVKHRITMLLKKPTRSLKYLIIPTLCACTYMITMACTFETGKVEEMITPKSSLSEKQKEEYRKIMDALSRLQAEAVLNQEPKEFIYPIHNNIIAGYGPRIHPVEGVRKMHWGLDFMAKVGTSIFAVSDGEVSLVQRQPKGYGLQIEILHANGFKSKYAHLSEAKVTLGQKVKQEDIIALSGNSGRSKGPHLHFELMKDGKKIDPEKFIKR